MEGLVNGGLDYRLVIFVCNDVVLLDGVDMCKDDDLELLMIG